MAADYFETRTYPIPTKIVADAIVAPAFAGAMQFRFVNTIPGAMGYTYRYLHGVTLLSWGEEIDITLTPAGDNGTQIKIRSTCSMAMQLIDWGKNKANVQAIWKYIENNLLAQYNSPRITQTTSFCGNCGAPVENGTAFCTKCGKSVG